MGNGVDIIYNFQAGQTKFGLFGGLTFEDLNFVPRGNFTLIEDADTGEYFARVQQVVTVVASEGNFVSI